MNKRYVYNLIEANDGTGDANFTIPSELVDEMGWKEGTVLDLKVEESPTGNVIVITEKNDGTNSV
jgi:hypothetical protein